MQLSELGRSYLGMVKIHFNVTDDTCTYGTSHAISRIQTHLDFVLSGVAVRTHLSGSASHALDIRCVHSGSAVLSQCALHQCLYCLSVSNNVKRVSRSTRFPHHQRCAFRTQEVVYPTERLWSLQTMPTPPPTCF